MCRESLCLRYARARLQPCVVRVRHRHSSYGLMRQTIFLLWTSVVPRRIDLCRLLSAPAGKWPFPTLSPPNLPHVSGTLPRWPFLVHLSVASQKSTGLLPLDKGSATTIPHAAYSAWNSISRLYSFLSVQTRIFANHAVRSYPGAYAHPADRGIVARATAGMLPSQTPS